jgi:hypothetical protein
LTSSPESYGKSMQDIQRQIDEADRLTKVRAEAALNSMYENYRKKLSDRLDYELEAAQQHRRAGNDYAAKHHDTLASIYKSLLERHDQKPST